MAQAVFGAAQHELARDLLADGADPSIVRSHLEEAKSALQAASGSVSPSVLETISRRLIMVDSDLKATRV